jgi:hypothetical protein
MSDVAVEAPAEHIEDGSASDVFEPAEALRTFSEMPVAERHRFWGSLSPDEREAVRLTADSVGTPSEEIAEPALPELERDQSSGGAVDDFVPVQPDDPRYGRTVQEARARVRAALPQLSAATLAKVTSLLEIADRYPDSRTEYGDNLQRAARLARADLDRVFAEAPFQRVKQTRTLTNAAGETVLVEKDITGRIRETVLGSRTERLQARDVAQAEDFGDEVTPEDVAGWSMARRVKFRSENPEAWEDLKRGGTVHRKRALASTGELRYGS